MTVAVISSIAAFLFVFVALCGGAWIVMSRRRGDHAGLSSMVRRRPSTVSVSLTVALAGILSFVVVIAAARLSLSLFEPVLAWATAQFWAVFIRPYGALVLGIVVVVASRRSRSWRTESGRARCRFLAPVWK